MSPINTIKGVLSIDVTVRGNGVNYSARHGKGKTAVTATSTSGANFAAEAVAAKVFKLTPELRRTVKFKTERLPNNDPAGLFASALYRVSIPELTLGGAS